jgi:predicted amino acid-binding ACT domain protein
MTRRGVTYEDLSERLAALGINDTAVNIRNKVARGRFSATFLVQCLTALGARALRLGEGIDGQ